MVKFCMQTWIESPEKYPMVINFTISPLIPFRPILHDDFGSIKPLEDSSLLLKRDNGKWFSVPEDVYRMIRGDADG